VYLPAEGLARDCSLATRAELRSDPKLDLGRPNRNGVEGQSRTLAQTSLASAAGTSRYADGVSNHVGSVGTVRAACGRAIKGVKSCANHH
jgi:uncharacterized FlgJ-related protein